MAKGRKRPLDGDPVADRRCLVTREAEPRAGMIRFVIDPDGAVVPDLAERLPGRGLWVSADREILSRAVDKKMFGRAAKRSVEIDPNLVDRVERLLVDRVIELLGLARRAGLAISGHDKVREALSTRRPGLLLEASDGAEDAVRRMRSLAGDRPVAGILSGEELGRPFGRDRVVHCFVDGAGVGSGSVNRLIRETKRLEGLRGGAVEVPVKRVNTGGEGASGLEKDAGTCIQGPANEMNT